METLCRACGTELAVAEQCEGCNEPMVWRCGRCRREKDSPHIHRALVQYVLAK